jgi:hypothetical protein
MKNLFPLIFILFHSTILTAQMGMVNEKKEIIIPFEYTNLASSPDCQLIGAKKNDKFGFITASNEEKIPFIYDGGSSFDKGYAKIIKNDKWGIINEQGKIIIEPQFRAIYGYKDGIFVFGDENLRQGLIDSTGRIITKEPYKGIYAFNTKAFSASKYKLFALFSIKTGEQLTEYLYDSIERFNDKYFIIRKNYKVGLIDMNGNLVVPIGAIRFGQIKGNLYYCKMHSETEFHLLNANREVIKTLNGIEEIGQVREEQMSLKKNGKWGSIDVMTGEESVPFLYDQHFYLSGNQCVAVKNGKKGIIDGNGKTLLPFDNYSELLTFKNDYAVFEKDGTTGFIHRDGTEFIPRQTGKYYDVEVLKNDYFFIKQGDKFGIVHKKKGTIIPAEYEKSRYLIQTKTNHFWMVKDGKRGLLNEQNEEVLPFIFDWVGERDEPGNYLAQTKNPSSLTNKNLSGNCLISVGEKRDNLVGLDLTLQTDQEKLLFEKAFWIAEDEENWWIYPHFSNGFKAPVLNYQRKKNDAGFEEILRQILVGKKIASSEVDNLECADIQLNGVVKSNLSIAPTLEITKHERIGNNLKIFYKITNPNNQPITFFKPNEKGKTLSILEKNTTPNSFMSLEVLPEDALCVFPPLMQDNNPSRIKGEADLIEIPANSSMNFTAEVINFSKHICDQNRAITFYLKYEFNNFYLNKNYLKNLYKNDDDSAIKRFNFLQLLSKIEKQTVKSNVIDLE